MPETKTDNPFALELIDVDKTDALELSGVFLPMLQTAKAIADKAMSMVVTDESQTELISECHDMEMKLRKIRTDADKERLALGKSALRKKQAIDGHFKVIRFCTEPAEEHLREQKNFVKLAKEKRLSELSERRIEQLSEFEVDTEFYNLAEMSEDGFQQLLETVKFHYERKLADQKEEEEFRIAKAASEVKRQKGIDAENKLLRAAAEKFKRKAEKERQEREKIEAKREAENAKKQQALEAKLEIELEAKQVVENELAREREEWQEAASLARMEERQKMDKIKEARLAPDKKKLQKLAVIIAAIEMPEVTSKEAKSIIEGTIELLNKTSNYIKTKSLNL